MVALHNSPITAHGNLKSSKCLIDGRWVCKISDHGLDSVKANQTEEDLGEYAENRSKSFIVISEKIQKAGVFFQVFILSCTRDYRRQPRVPNRNCTPSKTIKSRWL